MAPKRRRQGTLVWPGLAVAAVVLLSLSGALGSLRHAVALLVSDEDAPFADVARLAETDPDRLQARLLALLNRDTGLAHSLDGCYLIRERVSVPDCDSGAGERVLRDQADLRDLVIAPRRIGVIDVIEASDREMTTLSVPWRPRVRALLEDTASGLGELETGGAPASRNTLDTLSERLQDGDYGDLLARNHRITGACAEDARLQVTPDAHTLVVPAQDAAEVVGLLLSLEDRLCHGRSWLF